MKHKCYLPLNLKITYRLAKTRQIYTYKHLHVNFTTDKVTNLDYLKNSFDKFQQKVQIGGCWKWVTMRLWKERFNKIQLLKTNQYLLDLNKKPEYQNAIQFVSQNINQFNDKELSQIFKITSSLEINKNTELSRFLYDKFLTNDTSSLDLNDVWNLLASYGSFPNKMHFRMLSSEDVLNKLLDTTSKEENKINLNDDTLIYDEDYINKIDSLNNNLLLKLKFYLIYNEYLTSEAKWLVLESIIKHFSGLFGEEKDSTLIPYKINVISYIIYAYSRIKIYDIVDKSSKMKYILLHNYYKHYQKIYFEKIFNYSLDKLNIHSLFREIIDLKLVDTSEKFENLIGKLYENILNYQPSTLNYSALDFFTNLSLYDFFLHLNSEKKYLEYSSQRSQDDESARIDDFISRLYSRSMEISEKSFKLYQSLYSKDYNLNKRKTAFSHLNVTEKILNLRKDNRFRESLTSNFNTLIKDINLFSLYPLLRSYNFCGFLLSNWTYSQSQINSSLNNLNLDNILYLPSLNSVFYTLYLLNNRIYCETSIINLKNILKTRLLESYRLFNKDLLIIILSFVIAQPIGPMDNFVILKDIIYYALDSFDLFNLTILLKSFRSNLAFYIRRYPNETNYIMEKLFHKLINEKLNPEKRQTSVSRLASYYTREGFRGTFNYVDVIFSILGTVKDYKLHLREDLIFSDAYLIQFDALFDRFKDIVTNLTEINQQEEDISPKRFSKNIRNFKHINRKFYMLTNLNIFSNYYSLENMEIAWNYTLNFMKFINNNQSQINSKFRDDSNQVFNRFMSSFLFLTHFDFKNTQIFQRNKQEFSNELDKFINNFMEFFKLRDICIITIMLTSLDLYNKKIFDEFFNREKEIYELTHIQSPLQQNSLLAQYRVILHIGSC